MDKFSHLNRPKVFLLKDWLDIRFCAKICSEINHLTDSQSRIVGQSMSLCIDEKDEKTYDINILEPTRLLVQSRLIDLKPSLENFFSLEPTELQRPRFLPYKAGDFFVEHTDSEKKIEFPDYIKRPLVSIIIFLKNQTDHLDKESERKASLTFSKYLVDSHGVEYDLSVRSEAGLFVAFGSDINYTVQPVISGEQYMIVSHLIR